MHKVEGLKLVHESRLRELEIHVYKLIPPLDIYLIT